MAEGLRFYIASRLENAVAVACLSSALKSAGHVHTYDWTVHGPVFKPDAHPSVNVKAMRDVAGLELAGVISADAVIVLLPGGRGTHVEIGAALAAGKPIIFCGENPEPLTGNGAREFPWPCAFYYHPLALHVFDADENVRTRAVLALLGTCRA